MENLKDFCQKRVSKVWGTEYWLCNEQEGGYGCKYMALDPGHQCSLHRHGKDETFLVLEGRMYLEMQNPDGAGYTCAGSYDTTDGGIVTGIRMLSTGQRVRVPSGAWHRFIAFSDRGCVFIEFSNAHSNDDVERVAGEESR